MRREYGLPAVVGINVEALPGPPAELTRDAFEGHRAR